MRRMEVVALVVLGACGRLGFDSRSDAGRGGPDSAGDGRADDGRPSDGPLTSPIQHLGAFVQRSVPGKSSDTFTATARVAGSVIAMQVGCVSATPLASVTVTAPGWGFSSLTGIPMGAGQFYTSQWVAITPDTSPIDVTVTWTGGGGCTDMIELGDEFANVRTSGGVGGVALGAQDANTSGHCTISFPTPGDAVTVWTACYASTNTTGILTPGYAAGADDGAGDIAAYKLTTEPSGTAETIAFGGPDGTWVMDALSLFPP